MFCPKCNTPIPASGRFCPACGTEATDDVAFCAKCGAKPVASTIEKSEAGPPVSETMHDKIAKTKSLGNGPIQKGALFGAVLGFVLAFGIRNGDPKTGLETLTAFTMRMVIGAVLGAVFGSSLIVRRKVLERKARLSLNSRTVVDQLPNVAENSVRLVAIGIAGVSVFQFVSSCFGGSSGLMLSNLFGILSGSLQLVLWWALWNGLRRIGSPAAKYVLIILLASMMSVFVLGLSFGLARLLESNSCEAQIAMKCGWFVFGLLGVAGGVGLVAFPMAVEKNHTGRLLAFSLLVWPLFIVCGICMATFIFVGMPLGMPHVFVDIPPIVCNVVLAFSMARILSAPPSKD